MYKKIFIPVSFFMLSAIVLFTSCEKEVKINLPYEGNKIVLNALMMKDSFMYARLTNSSELNNQTTFPVPAGARIDLYENDLLKETMVRRTIFGKEYFVSSFKSQEGKKYTFKATATGLTNAEGSDVIPGKPSFEGVEFKEITTNNNNQSRLVIKLKDPAGARNYYRLRVYEADTNRTPTGPRVSINKYNRNYFKVDNLSSNTAFDIFGDIDYHQLFFTDDRFDGREVSLTINLSYYPSSNLYIAPELVQLSRDAYRFLQSRENQVNNDGNPFTEAVIIYNNIAGGYGIVGGMADSITAVRKR